MMIATVSFAQNSLVATLSHGGEVKMFYGVNAFKDAMEAAVDGDAISLSGGQFQSTDIKKAVSIRGAGISSDSPTIISGNIWVSISTLDERLKIEGVRFNNVLTFIDNTTDPYLVRCGFGGLAVFDNTRLAKFLNCEINMLGLASNSSSQFICSWINTICTPSGEPSADYINCVIYSYYDTFDRITNSSLLNCILINPGTYGFRSIPSSSTAQYCISSGNGNPFGNMGAFSNNISDVYGIFMDNNPYNDLTDEAKAKYLGMDGTPVGMYGGPCPFDTTPSYPIITKMNVANKTTEDGMLKVEINAE